MSPRDNEPPEFEPPEGTFTCPRHGYLGYSPACAECSRDAHEPDVHLRAAYTVDHALENTLSDLEWLRDTFPAVAYLVTPLHEQVSKLLAGPDDDPPRHPDAYEYGAPWGPDNPAPGSPWCRKDEPR